MPFSCDEQREPRQKMFKTFNLVSKVGIILGRFRILVHIDDDDDDDTPNDTTTIIPLRLEEHEGRERGNKRYEDNQNTLRILII